MAKVIWCSKGFCDRVAPVGVALGALAAVDELRKAKGLAPVCLPFLAEYLLPRKIFREQSRLWSELFKNKQVIDFCKEQISMADAILESKIITATEATDWKTAAINQEDILNSKTEDLTQAIIDNLSKLGKDSGKK